VSWCGRVFGDCSAIVLYFCSTDDWSEFKLASLVAILVGKGLCWTSVSAVCKVIRFSSGRLIGMLLLSRNSVLCCCFDGDLVSF
jgi:hypothetical protein